MTNVPFEPMDELVEGTCAACREPARSPESFWCSYWCRYRWKRWKERQEPTR